MATKFVLINTISMKWCMSVSCRLRVCQAAFRTACQPWAAYKLLGPKATRLHIHQKSTFQLTGNFFSDLCTKHSQVSSYELVIESEYHFLNEKCVKHCFSVSD